MLLHKPRGRYTNTSFIVKLQRNPIRKTGGEDLAD
jgi:hypothetical protein